MSHYSTVLWIHFLCQGKKKKKMKKERKQNLQSPSSLLSWKFTEICMLTLKWLKWHSILCCLSVQKQPLSRALVQTPRERWNSLFNCLQTRKTWSKEYLWNQQTDIVTKSRLARSHCLFLTRSIERSRGIFPAALFCQLWTAVALVSFLCLSVCNVITSKHDIWSVSKRWECLHQ